MTDTVKKTLTTPTAQEVKFSIGRFPKLNENHFLKNYLENDTGLQENVPKVVEIIEGIQLECAHGERAFSQVGKKVEDLKCAFCGKEL